MTRLTAPSAEHVAGNRQSWKLGCYGCAHSVKKDRSWECIQGITKAQGYPNRSKKDCFYYLMANK